MTEGEAKLTFWKKVDGHEITEKVTLTSDEYPELTAALLGPAGEQFKEELSRLVGRYLHVRATRLPLKVFAKLLYSGVDEGTDEESVLVQDVSSSGIRVAINRDVPLNLTSLTKVHFLLAVKDGEERRRLNLAAEFIRVAYVDDNHISLAFRFCEINPEEANLIDKGINLFFS